MADIVITAANVLGSANARRSLQKAGVAITAGQFLYFDTASGTVKLAKANGAAPANTLFGVAEDNAAINQEISVITSDPALLIGGTLPAGAVTWLSAVNAGGINATPADDVTGGTMTRIVLGIGMGSNTLNFNPVVGGIIP